VFPSSDSHRQTSDSIGKYLKDKALWFGAPSANVTQKDYLYVFLMVQIRFAKAFVHLVHTTKTSCDSL